MKYLIALFTLALIVVSCDKRKDFYRESNKTPDGTLTLDNTHSSVSSTIVNDSTIIDTLKIGFVYRFTISFEDESESADFDYSGDGNLYEYGFNCSNNDHISTGTHMYEWSPTTIGENYFTIRITDKYGKTIVYNFHVHVFDNRVPQISWVLEDVGNITPLEKKIVVSGNDGDALYGGSVLYYEYVINQDTTLYPGNEFFYIFPQAGNYLISVRAFDSDNQWSNPVIIDPYAIQ